MALFGKKKEENGAMPPMPPAPPKVDGFPNSSTQTPVGNIPEPTRNIDSLSAPPVPGGNLADIKSEVAQAPRTTNENQMPSPNFEQNVNQEEVRNDMVEMKDEIDDNNILDDDSLFDFSELENEMASSESGEVHEISSQKTDDDFDIVEHTGTTTPNELESLHFVNGQRRVVSPNETYFLTTKQFKSLLGIVEDVKMKVKESSEIHLKMLDIKAEEDIEYENLRKSFQFIEEKLYEVDNLIFEK